MAENTDGSLPAAKLGRCESLDILQEPQVHIDARTQMEGSEELTPSHTLLQACGDSLSTVGLQK